MRDLVELVAPRALARPGAAPPLSDRRFLLATMPAGPFGRRLARALKGMGASCARVIVNGGDLWDWGLKDTVFVRAPFEAWCEEIGRILAAREITDVIVFGDGAAYSAGALAAARSAGVRAFVLENGYQRPHWVTVEREGVNANSGLPRSPEAYADVETGPLGEAPPPVGAITPYHTAHMIAYFAGVILAWPFFRNYRYPYALRIWPQAWGHVRRYVIWLARHRAREREGLALLADPRPFFLACLQREGDSQLLKHSELKTNRAFMAAVIRSFAAHAPVDSYLIIKNHPLDPGVEDLQASCEALAWSHGLAGRVRFLDGGAFAPLGHAAAGVVAVNSTAALAALEFGAPVKLMGRALFDIEGLVDPKPLDEFWAAPSAPDPELLARFRRRLALTTQVYGSYHNPHVIARTATGVAARFACPEAEFAA
ncbi:MAG TPA: capsular biosynthesis protein [Caulobacteraceae bacterium]|nr:capsular biosynthesis protein [Caulobacteraceae bacterium]